VFETAAAVPRRRRPRRWRERGAVLVYLSPWIIGFVIFTLAPMIASLYWSFTKYQLPAPPKWIGTLNYEFMFTKDPFFWIAVRNTIWIIVVGLPIRIAFGIITALLLTRKRRGVNSYRTMFFLPTMAPVVAATLVFAYLLNPEYGPVNVLLRKIGISHPPLWFFSPQWSKPGLVLLGLWGVGDAMIIFLAGFLDVPKHLYEAADLEGASGFAKFRHVSLPMVSPVIFFEVVTGIIFGFQYFTQAYVVAGVSSGGAIGDPQNSTLFYSVHLYGQGFINFKMGYASAMAWVLLVISLVCTVAILRGSRRWVHYQGGAFLR
jgi:multiple sugar transport system permease protein